MNKTLVAIPFLAALSTSAFADVPSTYQVDFSTRMGGQAQRYTVFVADNSCGEISIKSAARENSFRVCAQPSDQKRVRLEIERHTRDQADEARAKAVVVATPGSASYDVLDAKMTVKAQ
jgi:hypothetical protein